MRFRRNREVEKIQPEIKLPEDPRSLLQEEGQGIYRINYNESGPVDIKCYRTDYDFWPIFEGLVKALTSSLNETETKYAQATKGDIVPDIQQMRWHLNWVATIVDFLILTMKTDPRYEQNKFEGRFWTGVYTQIARYKNLRQWFDQYEISHSPSVDQGI